MEMASLQQHVYLSQLIKLQFVCILLYKLHLKMLFKKERNLPKSQWPPLPWREMNKAEKFLTSSPQKKNQKNDDSADK